MAQRKKPSKRKQKVTIPLILLFLAVVATGLIFGEERVNLGLPDFNQLASLAGLTPAKPSPTVSSGTSDTEVHVIDVGQGDAMLIRQGDQFALIDAGVPQSAEKLVNYLKAAGVQKLSCVIMTHAHADHIGGMPQVLEAFPADRFILPDFTVSEVPTTRIFEKTMDALEAQPNCQVETAKVGTEIPLGEGTITIVGAGVKSDGQNNSSVCTRFVAPGLRLLNTGDAEIKAEQALVASGAELSADVFKAGHHGSTTSNTQELLTAASPRYIAISCGLNNDYGHPHAEIVERFEAIGAQIARTDQQGSIVYSVEESGITVRTER